MRLQNKVAIVTGSSSGLGRAISLHYAREGARVVCADLSPNARAVIPEEMKTMTHKAIKDAGGQAIFVTTDVGDAAQMKALVQSAVDEFGRVDILVNNAGIAIESSHLAPIHETDEETWDKTMRINSKSIFLGCKYAVAQMLKQEAHESGDRGWIINMASICGLVGTKGMPSYCSSKGAVVQLTRQVAMDYASERIHVNAICPGYTQTAILYDFANQEDAKSGAFDMNALGRLHPLKGLGMPNDIARMAVVLASEDASWMTGVCVPVDGGYTMN